MLEPLEMDSIYYVRLMMNILMTFDSTAFTQHLTSDDDLRMIDYIINEYGPALQYAIRIFEGDVEDQMRTYYQDLYLTAVLANDDLINDEPRFNVTPNGINEFIKRTINDDGEVISTRARYLELVEVCILHFNSQIIAVLRNIQNQGVLIYTVIVVDYANRRLNIMLTTNRTIQP